LLRVFLLASFIDTFIDFHEKVLVNVLYLRGECVGVVGTVSAS